MRTANRIFLLLGILGGVASFIMYIMDAPFSWDRIGGWSAITATVMAIVYFVDMLRSPVQQPDDSTPSDNFFVTFMLLAALAGFYLSTTLPHSAMSPVWWMAVTLKVVWIALGILCVCYFIFMLLNASRIQRHY